MHPAPKPPWRVVLDTNVLLSLWVFADSRFAVLAAACHERQLLPLGNSACMAEFERVLAYPEFTLDARRIHGIVAGFGSQVEWVAPPAIPMPALPPCRDPDDQKFLELARDGSAHFLVTSDKALLRMARRKVIAGMFRIVTPEAMLRMLA